MFFFLQVFQQYFCKSSLPPLNPITEKGYVVSATTLCSHRKSGIFHVTIIHKKTFCGVKFLWFVLQIFVAVDNYNMDERLKHLVYYQVYYESQL